MSAFQTVLYEKRGNLARVRLNRPEHLNAFSVQMRDDLYEILSAVRDDPDTDCVVVSGEGRSFCAGADLKEFLTAPSPIRGRQIRRQRDVWGLLHTLPKVLVAMVHGHVLGSGLELALFCDLRIASEDAVFGLPELGVGIIPAAGGTQTLPRAIGRARALEMLLTGRWIDAREAHEVGLVNRVVPRDQLESAADSIAQAVLSNGAELAIRAKEAVVRGADLPLAEALLLEQHLSAVSTERRNPWRPKR
jgi:enoyl-CoA hydratase/carnithine racemase